MNILQICIPQLSHVATLQSEIQKGIFNNVIHIFHTIYVISEKKQISTVVLQL